jgi:HEAT repeat protein
VSSLRNMGTPTARAALIQAAESADDPQVRAAALQELPNLGTDDAQRILTDALLDSNTDIRYGATSALEGSGSTQAAQAIADALRSGTLSDDEAMPLAQALERMGGEVAKANAALLEDLLPAPVDTGMPVEPIDIP